MKLLLAIQKSALFFIALNLFCIAAPVVRINSALATSVSKFSDDVTTAKTDNTPIFAAQQESTETNTKTSQLDEPNEAMDQVTSVTQLTDVQPTDWAFQALQALVERYRCFSGHPNQIYQGNRALTRYEFAAGLNTCLERINELIAGNTESLVSREDVAKLQRLQETFAAELATLRGRVDALEVRSTTVANQQFSTTSKLFGQVIIGLQGRTSNQADLFPRDGKRETQDPGDQINLLSNAQLTLLTQFSNRSILLMGLQAGQGSTAPRLTNNVRLSYEGNTGGQLLLSDLTYRFLLGDKLAAIVGAEGVNMVSIFRGPNRVESAGFGPVSAFAQRNPILNIGAGRAGAGFDWQFARRASLQAVYSSANADSPSKGAGLFNGYTTVGVQLALTPIDPVDITLYYAHAYSPDGILLTRVGDDQLVPFTSNGSIPLRTHAVGATLNWRLGATTTIGGWVGYTNSHASGKSGNVETINWMAFLNLPDLFGRGNLGGIYVGQPPRIISSDLPVGNNLPDLLNGGLGEAGEQPGTTTHMEMFYRWRLSKSISITPGVIFLLQPRNTPDSDPIVIGTVRTTFSF